MALDNVKGLRVGDSMVINRGGMNEEVVQITSLELQHKVRSVLIVLTNGSANDIDLPLCAYQITVIPRQKHKYLV